MAANNPYCAVCGRPIDGQGMQVVRARGFRYHGWCWITVCAPSAPKPVDDA